jgi:dTDP-4-amino-4,6-dideoxygalactose transaminase
MSRPVHVPFLDLKRACREQQPLLEAAIQRVIGRGWLILGDEVASFEREFASYCGVGYGVGVGSGTDALHLALRAFQIGPDDEVITVANTCVPTVAAIEMAGAKAAFCDVDPATLTMDPARLGDALTPRTRAVIPVHLYGACAAMDAIVAFARQHKLVVIEDAAHAHGAKYHGRRAGSLADAAAFSFYPTKNLGALGDGGMVVTNDAAIAGRVRMLRSYGESDRYVHAMKGVNSRLDELQAAVLRVRLAWLEEQNSRRREIASRYREALASCGVQIAQDAASAEHACHLFVVRVQQRERVRERLLELGVQTLVHYPTLIPAQPAYLEYADAIPRLKESARAVNEVISLPLYPQMTMDEVERVMAAVAEAVRPATA